MAERLSDRLRDILRSAQGRVVNLGDLRAELRVNPAEPAWDTVKVLMYNFSRGKEKLVKPSGLKDGVYKVITQVKPVRVFADGRERMSVFDLKFPRDFNTGMEMDLANYVVIRKGDVITVGGVSNYGKTCVALNFCGENIDYLPILMGNEYTTRVGDTDEYEPSPRFVNRLNNMDWVKWVDDKGNDRFTLLPVRADYAEHIVKDRINIIDWINLSADRLYDISRVMDDIKAELGRGICIVVLQKGEGDMARGGQFTKDFTDCELLIDKLTEFESLLTVGKVKEYTGRVIGKTFAFGIEQGVKIINLREVVKCTTCYGKGWQKAGNSTKPCETCLKTGFIDK